MVHKCLNGLCPSYLINPFNTIHDHPTRLSSNNALYLPKPNFECYKSSFQYAGASLWNQLPPDLKNSATLELFQDIKNKSCMIAIIVWLSNFIIFSSLDRLFSLSLIYLYYNTHSFLINQIFFSSIIFYLCYCYVTLSFFCNVFVVFVSCSLRYSFILLCVPFTSLYMFLSSCLTSTLLL